MTADELRGTLDGAEPPAGLPLLVEALWWQAHGEWKRAHGMVDELQSADGAWVHAYLHRVEGDVGNAGYWYRQAGRPVCKVSLEEEWAELVGALAGA